MNTPLLEQYDSITSSLAGHGVVWLENLRRDGIETYRNLGIPGPRVEAWKYTNLTRIRKNQFANAFNQGAQSLENLPDGAVDIDAPKIVLINGRLNSGLSNLNDLPQGIKVSSLSSILESDAIRLKGKIGKPGSGHPMPMLALNTAYLSDGIVINIDADSNISTPIHIVSIGAAADQPIAFHPRTLIFAAEHSQTTIYESHIGSGKKYFNNGATEINLAKNATLRHRKLQNDTCDAYHVAATTVSLNARAQYENYTLHVGSRLARNEIHVELAGQNGNCKLYGAYLGRAAQHIDTTTFIDHAVPECTSREVYKGALDDSARGVFQGKILVRKDAQKSNGHQLSKALMLSQNAEIDAKPELEIYADDVKCSHGAAAGELDEEQLFYLRARGIKEVEARNLLVLAFLEDSLEVIIEEDRRKAFRSVISDWLAERSESRES